MVDIEINSYQQALKWLFGFLEDLEGRRYSDFKSHQTRFLIYETRIRRMQDFLEFSGNPQNKYHSIHVAGTSGKGSVTSMIAAILNAAGYRTASHTSPYLQICNEKLLIDGEMITLSDFTYQVEKLRRIYISYQKAGREFNDIKFGEAWVALMHLWFEQNLVDWAVIETGMGGRYDPTNVLSPDVSVITNVNEDHVEELGPRLTDIAEHKAGIIKPGSIAITAEKKSEVLAILQKEADKVGTQLLRVDNDYYYQCHEISDKGVLLSVFGTQLSYPNIHIKAQGSFQVENAALAIATVDALQSKYSMGISRDVVMDALDDFLFPGRMEIIQSNPTVILDGAHNPHKIGALVDSLRFIYSEKRFTVIYGALSMKDTQVSLQILLPIVERIIFTEPHVIGKPSMPVDSLVETARDLIPDLPIFTSDTINDAISLGLSKLLDEKDILIITGSIYLVGDARNYWNPKNQLLRSLNGENVTVLS